MMVWRLLSFWDGLFSGALLNFQGVVHLQGVEPQPDPLGLVGGFKFQPTHFETYARSSNMDEFPEIFRGEDRK